MIIAKLVVLLIAYVCVKKKMLRSEILTLMPYKLKIFYELERDLAFFLFFKRGGQIEERVYYGLFGRIRDNI